MKNASIGSLIRASREAKGLTRAQLARRIRITTEYLGHLENDSHVHLSDVLMKRISVASGMSKLVAARVKKLQSAHNERSRRWYRNYRKSA